MIASNALQNLQDVFLDQPSKKEQCIRIMAIVDNRRIYKYILSKYVIENDYLKFFNVVIIEGNKT